MTDIRKKLDSLGGDSTHYQASVHCFNCAKRNVNYIPKGVPAHTVSVDCEWCGCKIDCKLGALAR